MLSFFEVEDFSFLIIPFKFENLTFLELRSKFSFIVERNISEMDDKLVGPNYVYSIGTFIINKNTPGRHLNDILLLLSVNDTFFVLSLTVRL